MSRKRSQANPAVKLFLSVPPLSEHLPACHHLPVLAFVDPPGADLTATVHPDSNGQPCPSSDECFGAFRIVWVANVKAGETRLVQVEATANGDSTVESCTIARRHDAPLKVSTKAPMGTYGTPTIVYPPLPVPRSCPRQFYHLWHRFPQHGPGKRLGRSRRHHEYHSWNPGHSRTFLRLVLQLYGTCQREVHALRPGGWGRSGHTCHPDSLRGRWPRKRGRTTGRQARLPDRHRRW
jgi:hypothetical protein